MTEKKRKTGRNVILYLSDRSICGLLAMKCEKISRRFFIYFHDQSNKESTMQFRPVKRTTGDILPAVSSTSFPVRNLKEAPEVL